MLFCLFCPPLRYEEQYHSTNEERYPDKGNRDGCKPIASSVSSNTTWIERIRKNPGEYAATQHDEASDKWGEVWFPLFARALRLFDRRSLHDILLLLSNTFFCEKNSFFSLQAYCT